MELAWACHMPATFNAAGFGTGGDPRSGEVGSSLGTVKAPLIVSGALVRKEDRTLRGLPASADRTRGSPRVTVMGLMSQQLLLLLPTSQDTRSALVNLRTR